MAAPSGRQTAAPAGWAVEVKPCGKSAPRRRRRQGKPHREQEAFAERSRDAWHATGYKLANQRVDSRSLQHYLDHKNIHHTTRYTPKSCESWRRPEFSP